MLLFHSLVFLAFLLKSLSANTFFINFYSRLEKLNESDSYERLKQIQLYLYELKYDIQSGRQHLGVLVSDATEHFPESITIIPQYTIMKDNSPPIVIKDHPVVDHSVITLHGIAALRALIMEYERESIEVSTLKRVINSQFDEISSIQGIFRDHYNQTNQLLSRLESLNAEIADLMGGKAALEFQRGKSEVDFKINEERSLLLYEEDLTRLRLNLESSLTQQAMQQKINLEIKLSEQKEELRKKNQELILSSKREFNKDVESQRVHLEKEKIRAELEAKSKQELANEDMTIRKMHLQSKLDTDKIVDIIRVVTNQILKIISDVLAKPKELAMVILVVLSVFFAIYLFRELIGVIKHFVQSRIGRPSLVRETSYEWGYLALFHAILELFTIPSKEESFENINYAFSDVILAPDDKDRIIQIAFATKNTKRSGAPFRHLLLHGPPGTGKTLIARKLAMCSGMDYALMSGGDVGSLGEDSINQLHDLFRWASRSRRGLLLFIDEAEAFLSTRARSTGDDSSSRNALHALLYQTGVPSRHFMLVLATNRPEDIDSAILDRMDISMNIGSPGLAERKKLVQLYWNVHIQNAIRDSKENFWPFRSLPLQVEQDCMNEEKMATLAAAVDGFSGREIAKLFISIKFALLLSTDRVLTSELLQQTLRTKIAEHHQKLKFTSYSNE